MTQTTNKALASVIKLLQLEQVSEHTFIGPRSDGNNNRIYGGQVVSQALMAALATVENRPAISLKSDFLRAGDPEQSVTYTVENVRDGRSFNTRRVLATQIQKGTRQIIFTMSASFQEPESGLEHQVNMQNIAHPDSLPSSKDNWNRIKHKLPDHAKQWYEDDRAFEERPVFFRDPIDPVKHEPSNAVWFKANGQLENNNNLHQGLFAWISDMSLLDNCILPHEVSWMQPNFQSASLDHSIWFHRELRVDEWLCFVGDSPVSYGGRGFNKASVYTEQGVLVASVIQEGLIRIKH